MKQLNQLLTSLPDYKLSKDYNGNISNITDDNRKVVSGGLFVAIKGLTVDSHDFIPDAIKRGAAVVVGEQELKNDWDVVYVQVPDSREALGLLASAWYDHPSKKLTTIGVTGTDGKTTTCNLLFAILKASGAQVGMVSTISAQVGGEIFDTGLHVTNPAALDLHRLLHQMVINNCKYAVLEVTSHGIHQKRIAGVKFDIAVLTNVTHEHLDYHKSWEEYRNTKALLFTNVKHAVLNKDDESFDYFKKQLAILSSLSTYSINSEADFQAFEISSGKLLQFKIRENGTKIFPVKSSLIGIYNASNMLAAAATARYLGLDWGDIITGIKNLDKLTGRLEEVKNDKQIHVYIDFAHTPNALKEVLTALRNLTKGKLIVVYGCASERDVQKRSLMPEVSVQIADISVFTAEDPRKEDVNAILEEMSYAALKAGAQEIDKGHENNGNRSQFVKIPERGEAIFRAINEFARPGDTVVICGKGHEKSMSYFDVEYPWTDQEGVQDALNGKIKTISWKK